MHYKYIVIGNCEKNGWYDYYSYAYKEVNELDYSLFDNSYFFYNFFVKMLYRLHNSQKINKILNLPFKELWLKKRIKRYAKIFNFNDSLCFLLFSDCLKDEKIGLSRIIRETYPNSKIVYFFQDLVCKDKNKEDFLNNNRNIADLIYTFDYGDAEKYDLKFHNIPYSDLSGLFKDIEQKYDICFVGQAKDRLDDILSAYRVFKKQGLKCMFYIIGVSKDNKVIDDDIHYCDFIPYKDYLRIVSESKCILEIMQKGGTGNTIRVSEAIALDKLLISNNKTLLQNSLYDSKYMMVYENLEDVNIREFIELNKKVNYENKEQNYPSAFFKQIEKDLDMLETDKIDKKHFKQD